MVVVFPAPMLVVTPLVVPLGSALGLFCAAPDGHKQRPLQVLDAAGDLPRVVVTHAPVFLKSGTRTQLIPSQNTNKSLSSPSNTISVH